ncbi:MAG: VOC family protein [Planctomycetota bacterium]
MKRSLPSILLLSSAGLLGLAAARPVQEPAAFTRTTIDVGVVVRDVEASAAFYADTLGFTELEGFSVPAGFCTDTGLTDGHPLAVRVFVLGAGEQATKIKLMEVPAAEPKAGDHAFIHSQLGLSYLTVFVRDTNAALQRLERAGVSPIAKGPVRIGEEPGGSYLTLVRDPDGNLIELIGPKL